MTTAFKRHTDPTAKLKLGNNKEISDSEITRAIMQRYQYAWVSFYALEKNIKQWYFPKHKYFYHPAFRETGWGYNWSGDRRRFKHLCAMLKNDTLYLVESKKVKQLYRLEKTVILEYNKKIYNIFDAFDVIDALGDRGIGYNNWDQVETKNI